MTELKPCPFCGSSNVSVFASITMDGEASTICGTCGVEGPITAGWGFRTDLRHGISDHAEYQKAEAEAIRLWNTRPQGDEADATIQSLVKDVNDLSGIAKELAGKVQQVVDALDEDSDVHGLIHVDEETANECREILTRYRNHGGGDAG